MNIVANNMLGLVETPSLPSNPYRVDIDGRPYVPTGDGGVVLGVSLGDGAFDTDTDHAAPGACLVHPDSTARFALTAYSCFGNPVTVRSGAAQGERGVVLGKRGEQGRVIVYFAADVLAALRPGDAMAVRTAGQGAAPPGLAAGKGLVMMNADPAALAVLPINITNDHAIVSVRAQMPSVAIGNGIGRPAEMWDLDLQVLAREAAAMGLNGLRLGDLVAMHNLDVRHNAGFRRDYTTIGIVVHGHSPQPGHGPGVMPLLCGPDPLFAVSVESERHPGLTGGQLLSLLPGTA
jgi:uncharacterized protein DUF4438